MHNLTETIGVSEKWQTMLNRAFLYALLYLQFFYHYAEWLLYCQILFQSRNQVSSSNLRTGLSEQDK